MIHRTFFFRDCRVVRDPQTQKSKGYGFVSFLRKQVSERLTVSLFCFLFRLFLSRRPSRPLNPPLVTPPAPYPSGQRKEQLEKPVHSDRTSERTSERTNGRTNVSRCIFTVSVARINSFARWRNPSSQTKMPSDPRTARSHF